jgi:hypothetical protein
MATQRSAFVRALVGAACLFAALGLAAHAFAAPETLREGLFGPRPNEGRTGNAPVVARYVAEDGVGFVFDKSGRRPLLKFDNSTEIWALSRHSAPRGDLIYKNDLGRSVLRSTRIGGVTLFTDARPDGLAASLSGGGAPLRLTPLGPPALAERLLQASTRASRSARRLIRFDAEAAPASSALIGDAAMVSAEALARIARRSDGAARLAGVTRVTLVEGKKPNITRRRDTLVITIVSVDGFAGRPSSARIIDALND